jgi:UDP-glucuronate 4-epimerase
MKKNKILITGVSGFIGYHVAKLFLIKNFDVIGIDNNRKTYDPKYKKQRLKILNKYKNFTFIKKDIAKINSIKQYDFNFIIHLAGEAGVRNSLKKPNFFIEQNTQNTIKIFEFAIKNKIKNIFYASSSSVYGNCNTYPSHEKLVINKPLSVYGLSKTACELLAYYYNSVFNINSIGFRFFTVYGPLGRPDMSINIFIKSIIKNKKIILFNQGKNYRDYTFVNDVTSYIYECFKKIKKKKSYLNIFNIGGQNTIRLDKLVNLIEKNLNKKAKIVLMKKNKLDPVKSLATNKSIISFTRKNFNTPIKFGIKMCIDSFLKNKI